MKRSMVGWFILWVLLFTAAQAQPNFGVTKQVLDNGLVVLVKEKHDIPVVSCMVWYKVGGRNEEIGKTGVSHFLEHMLFKGTKKLKKGDIDLITLKNGGSNNAFTSNDYTAYYFNFASDRWEEALEIEADRMVNNQFLPEEFNPEKQVVIEELKRGNDGPWDQLFEDFQAAAFKAHPYQYPVIGWITDLDKLSIADMEAYYRTFYQPANAILVIVGDVNTEKTLEKVRQLFGTLERRGAIPDMRAVEPEQLGERRIIVHKESNLPRLLVGWHTPKVGEKDSYPLTVLATILSGGKSSRLYQELVEKEKAVTFVNAFYDDARDPSLFAVQAELQPGHELADVEKSIYTQIDRLAAGGISDSELVKAKNQTEAGFVFDQETASGQANALGRAAAIFNYAYAFSYVDSIRKVTREEVVRVARKYLVPDNRTVGWLVPKGGSPESTEQGAKGSTDQFFGAVERDAAAVPAGQVLLQRRKAYKSSDRAYPLQTPPAQTTPPAHSIVAPAKLNVSQKTLGNGLTVLLLERRGNPTVAINAFVKAGSRFDPEEKAGLANLTARMLDEGTTARTGLEIAQAIDFVGGSLSTSGGYAGSTVSAQVLSKDLDLGLNLVADVVRRPVFDSAKVEDEKQKIAAEIKSSLENPRTVGSLQLNELVYGKHPLHRPSVGYEETVAAITRQDVVNFHKFFYLPNDALLAVVGDFKAADVIKKIEKYFGTWEKRSLALPVVPEIARQSDERHRYRYMDKEQINIYLGHLGIKRDNPDYYALEVFDTMLGGGPGFTSRIPKNLRDNLGLAYTTFSNITGTAGIDPGRFVAYIGTSIPNKDKALEGLKNEIKQFLGGPLGDDELEFAKAYLTGSFVFDFETNSQIAGFLINAVLYNLGFDYLAKYPKLIEAVTKADVARVAKKYIDLDHMSLVIVGKVNERGEVVETKP